MSNTFEILARFLDRYGDRIIQLGRVSAPVLELLAAYSPEYPCLLQGLDSWSAAFLWPREGRWPSASNSSSHYERVRDVVLRGACRDCATPARSV